MDLTELTPFQTKFFNNRTINPFTSHPICEHDEAYMTLVRIFGQPPPLNIPELNVDVLCGIALRSDINTLKSFRLCNHMTMTMCSEQSFWIMKFAIDGFEFYGPHPITLDKWFELHKNMSKLTKSVDATLALMDHLAGKGSKYHIIGSPSPKWMRSIFKSAHQGVMNTAVLSFIRDDDYTYHVNCKYRMQNDIKHVYNIDLDVDVKNFRGVLVNYRYHHTGNILHDTLGYDVIPEYLLRVSSRNSKPIRDRQEFLLKYGVPPPSIMDCLCLSI